MDVSEAGLFADGFHPPMCGAAIEALSVVADQDRALTCSRRLPWGPDAFDELCADAELQLIRSVLAGPSPEEEPELRALGWRPGDEDGIGAKRAQQEIEQAARFDADPSWRRGRIRDVVAAREMLIELNETFHETMRDRGAELLDVFPEPAVTRAVFDAMPSFDVAVSLKASYHSDANHRWTCLTRHRPRGHGQPATTRPRPVAA